MPTYTIRHFNPEDIPAITTLQQAYQQVYPHAPVIPGEVYLSPGFESGRNIFCAWSEKGELSGYAPLLPVLTGDPGFPNIVWAEVKADPHSKTSRAVKEALFERVLDRAREICADASGHRTRLNFQYHPSETASIDFVVSRGCTYLESVFRMMRDLSQPLEAVSPPASVEVRRWHMDSEAEQQAYVQARNEAFPDAPVALGDWQSFLGSPAWAEGTAVTAFAGQEIAGSVAVYWDETLSRMTGLKAGYTEYIFVREKWRRRGIAAFMIYQGLLYLKEHGREAAFLEVKAANADALGLYQRLGYRVVDETRIYQLEI